MKNKYVCVMHVIYIFQFDFGVTESKAATQTSGEEAQ